jgi:general L-amino acid transport system permease protein
MTDTDRSTPTGPDGSVAVDDPDQGPPVTQIGARAWVRENLFGSRWDGVLTVVFGALLAYVIYRATRFVFVTGRWEIVEVNLTNYMVGRFPRDELWRLVTVGIAAIGLGAVWLGYASRRLQELATSPDVGRDWRRTASRAWPFALMIVVILMLTRTITPTLLVLAATAIGVGGFVLGNRVSQRAARWVDLGIPVAIVAVALVVLFLPGYGYGSWGGMVVNLFAATVAIAASFPIGVLLALGRRSDLPGVRVLCVIYIELIRGVPLITLLLMASFVVGFLFPPGWSRPDLLTRALIMLTAFTAAYVAEIVRGGLQGVPRGQVEAAQAVGLAPWKVTRLVVLPQALRSVIPALVGQFISLWKDTSLLYVISVLELLRVAQVIQQQPDFRAQGLQGETFLFAGFIFWIFAYAMSRESQRLEHKLGVGER